LLLAAFGLSLILSVTPGAHAQLGGIAKKKAVEKVTGKKDTTAASGAKTKPKERCDPTALVVTSDVVDRYSKGFAARDAMVAKLAKEPGPTGAYYSAALKREALQRRKDEFDLHRGPDWEKSKAIQKRLATGDTAAITAYVRFGHEMDPYSVQVPPLDWDAQEKANAKVDSAMKAAGQFSDCDWLGIGEKLPRIVYILADNPSAKDFQGFATASEGAAVKPRFLELARGLGIKYVSPEDKARLKKEEEDAAAAAAVIPSTGDPRLDCTSRYQSEWVKRHKAELDKAQESQDMATVMSLTQQMNEEAMEKCNQ
jgi:hypothetical protein